MEKRENRFVALLAEKDKRDNKRYTQREISQATGLRTTTISRLVHGEEGVLETMNVKTLIALAKFLGCQLSDLLPTGTDERPRPGVLG